MEILAIIDSCRVLLCVVGRLTNIAESHLDRDLKEYYKNIMLLFRISLINQTFTFIAIYLET